MLHKDLINFIRDTYQSNDVIPLHKPNFTGNEKKYINETIDTTFVSSVGKFVDEFEQKIETFTKTKKAVATVNGTSALHSALYMAGVKSGDLVITQSLTFVATCNALYHMGAEPIFLDVTEESLGLCPKALEVFLTENAEVEESGNCVHKKSGKKISAVVPMHTFGHPVDLDKIVNVCSQWHITLVEDAAESLGSYYKGQHTGTFGQFGAMSFNGNKIITTGGGGILLCHDIKDGHHAKHITTTAKVDHPYEFYHDEPGFNYRMPNLNAALGCAQMEVLPEYLRLKRQLADQYKKFFEKSEYNFVVEPDYAQSNYWLNAVKCPSQKAREELLLITNDAGVMTRPVWKLMHRLPMFRHCLRGDLTVSENLESCLVNLPSTPVLVSRSENA